MLDAATCVVQSTRTSVEEDCLKLDRLTSLYASLVRCSARTPARQQSTADVQYRSVPVRTSLTYALDAAIAIAIPFVRLSVRHTSTPRPNRSTYRDIIYIDA